MGLQEIDAHTRADVRQPRLLEINASGQVVGISSLADSDQARILTIQPDRVSGVTSLDVATQEIADGELFYRRHGIYLDVTAVQWAALLVHLWCVQAPAKPN